MLAKQINLKAGAVSVSRGAHRKSEYLNWVSVETAPPPRHLCDILKMYYYVKSGTAQGFKYNFVLGNCFVKWKLYLDNNNNKKSYNPTYVA